MEPLCTGCEITSWLVIAKFHGHIKGNGANALKFLRDHGVLPQGVTCPKCGSKCHQRGDTPRWYCASYVVEPGTRKRLRCNYTVSDYKGTFFENCRIEPWKLVLFVNHWLRKHCDYQEVIQNLHLSTDTCVRWKRTWFEVTESWLRHQEPIGGCGFVVEISETYFGLWRYEQGGPECPIWAFGGIERISKRFFVIPLLSPLTKKKDKDTLLHLITKYIQPGSVIVSDSWGTCLALKEHGYTHLVKHVQNPIIHTNTIDQLWQELKEWLKNPRPKKQAKYFKEFFSRYLFVRQNKRQLLHSFFVEAARLYPPQKEERRPHPRDREAVLDDKSSLSSSDSE